MSDSNGGTLEDRARKFWEKNWTSNRLFADVAADFARTELKAAAKIAAGHEGHNSGELIVASEIAAAIRAYAEQKEKNGTK